MFRTAVFALVLVTSVAQAQENKAFDAAAAFGARPSASGMSLSPDGQSVAFIRPDTGPGTILTTVNLNKTGDSRAALYTNGKPDRLGDCRWLSDQRLVCILSRVINDGKFLTPISRWIAVDREGSNFRMLSNNANENTVGYLLHAGEIIDWLPDEAGSVLISREYSPDAHVGSTIGSVQSGIGVDRIDTRTGQTRQVEAPDESVKAYIADGRGNVRVMALEPKRTVNGEDTGIFEYRYRKTDSREWLKLSDYNSRDGSGFKPIAVDHDLNVVYGFRRNEGRMALFSIKLDGSMTESVVYARPDSDVDDNDIIRIGRRNRVVGAYSLGSERTEVFIDPDIEKVSNSLQRALPGHPGVSIEDASVSEQKLLIFAIGNDMPGHYYLYDRSLHQLRPLLAARSELEGVALGTSRFVQYAAKDGTTLSAYLTVPPGTEHASGLPAIVLPNDGGTGRDESGFDWLAQYYAARGYAVLEPNFRGATHSAQRWLERNGYKSWRIAVGDVLDSGHWLVSQGIANPNRLVAVGWSYGGYLALQSAVVEPGLFKAIVGIAPTTDLESLKESWRGWTNFDEVSSYVGTGPHVREGSPARNADKIKVPVILFHGMVDREISYRQSQLMASSLASAGVKHELVTYDGLDRYLEDSTARTDLLRRSDAFLRQAIGLAP
jgi:dipeptidyl aminopeptidase/acylaminoacyl peptidase